MDAEAARAKVQTRSNMRVEYRPTSFIPQRMKAEGELRAAIEAS